MLLTIKERHFGRANNLVTWSINQFIRYARREFTGAGYPITTNTRFLTLHPKPMILFTISGDL